MTLYVVANNTTLPRRRATTTPEYGVTLALPTGKIRLPHKHTSETGAAPDQVPDLRHSCLSLLASRGEPIRDLQALAGHSSFHPSTLHPPLRLEMPSYYPFRQG
jgi:integrase